MEIKNKIKVCHVTSAHNRYDGRIFLKQCTSLANNGYDVILVCCDNLPNEIKDGVHIISTNKKFNSVYDRFFNSKKVLKKKCLEINADIYEFHDPDLLSLALDIKKLGKKVIFDSHEDYPALFLERDWIPKLLKRILSNFYEMKEKRVFKKLDYIICVADYQIERINKINTNVSIITNYPIIKNIEIRKKRDDNVTKLCFAGGVRDYWNHDTIIKVINNIDNVKYTLAGNYTNNYFKYLSELPGFEKLCFLGKIDHNKVEDLYYNSDIGMALCSYRPNTGYKKGSMGITKIFEYMMYEIPVIFTDFEVFLTILEEGKFGIAVNPYSESEVKAAIEYLIKNPKEAIEMGKRGRQLIIDTYNWETQIPILLNIYKRVLNDD